MIVYVIIIATVLVSSQAFRDNVMLNRFAFNPHRVNYRKEYYRLFSHGVVHADWTHLLVNMLVLYSFSGAVIEYFGLATRFNGAVLFTILYVTALPMSSVYSFIKQKNNPYYTAIGASGAVSAVVFASIFFAPWHMLYFFGVIPIPGIMFGAGYLVYSWYMGKRNIDNVGHDAHFFGALYGFLFPLLVRPSLITDFIAQINPFN